jgi:hypothetical protein
MEELSSIKRKESSINNNVNNVEIWAVEGTANGLNEQNF